MMNTIRKQLKPAAAALWLTMSAMVLTESADAADEPRPAAPAVKTRVGVYDSRAVALAFYRSQVWRAELEGMQRERQKAQAVGDSKRVAELEKKGADAQALAHQQTFGNAPIDNVLAAMKDALPQIQKRAGVERITASAPKEASVEIVDVTSQMVAEFQPTPKTLEMIEGLKKHPPVKDTVPSGK
jgi:hypothetical protein